MSRHALTHREIDQTVPSADCDRSAYLRSMRQVAGAVAVVTTDGAAGRHGATVTAFCSVSADPPTLLVCLRGGSRIAQAVASNGVFTLSVLPEEAVTVARIFAGEFDRDCGDRFGRVALVDLPGLAPAIAGSVSLACRVVKSERHESHVIFLGRVIALDHRVLAPLVYRDGRYCALRHAEALA
ncbi:MAG: flavin reductase family protein [Gemmobacter sp.]